jgi:predicted HAD superfamily Cof-like phosphohydrolase
VIIKGVNKSMNETNPTFWPADIADMHTKFGVNKVVNTLSAEQLKTYLKFRLDMVQEEVNEAKVAYETGDADGIVDALIDNIVFAIGTLDAFGIDAYTAWNEVHSKNMVKTPGVKASRPNPYGFPDLIKPEGWTAPSHVDNVGLLSKVFE